MKNNLIIKCNICGKALISPLKNLTKYCKNCAKKNKYKNISSQYHLFKLLRINLNKNLNIVKILNSDGKYNIQTIFKLNVNNRVFSDKLILKSYLISLKNKIELELKNIEKFKFYNNDNK